MKGSVLFCDSVSFKGTDGKEISGYRVGVLWTTYKGESHCCDVWSHSSFYTGQTVKVVRRRTDSKMFVFPWEDS